MSFNTTVGKVTITATSSQTEFDYLFKIYEDTDIAVYQNDTKLTLTSEYSVVINGDNGGEVTLVTGATAGDEIKLIRELPITRETEYQNRGDLSSDTLNTDQEYQTYLIADRSVEIDETDEAIQDQITSIEANIDDIEAEMDANESIYYKNSAGGVSNLMPVPSGGTALGWNSSGTALTNLDASVGGGGAGGQYLGLQTIKAVAYSSQTESGNIILGSDTTPLNGFAIDSLTIEEGGSFTIEDGSVFKVL